MFFSQVTLFKVNLNVTIVYRNLDIFENCKYTFRYFNETLKGLKVSLISIACCTILLLPHMHMPHNILLPAHVFKMSYIPANPYTRLSVCKYSLGLEKQQKYGYPSLPFILYSIDIFCVQYRVGRRKVCLICPLVHYNSIISIVCSL